jgi:hypothetical protein
MPGVIDDAKDQAAFPGVPFEMARFPGGNIPVFAGQPRVTDPQEYDLAAFSRAWDSACRRHYPAKLKRTRDYHQAALARLTLPSGKASQKSRPIKHFAGRHRHCAAVGMVHLSGEDFPIFEGYRFQLEEALFPVR